jgi:hypothetical protein
MTQLRRSGREAAGHKIARAVRTAALALIAISLPAISAWQASAQSASAAQKVIQGKVFGADGNTLTGAVVYLKDLKSLEIKTYISSQDGVYRFGQLNMQDDYELWAESGGHKTKVKNISSFDSKKLFQISLHLEDK